MSLGIRETNAFRRDKRRLGNSGFRLEKLDAVIKMLSDEVPLEYRQRDHPLIGNWIGHRECHIAPDWLLIYKIVGNELWLVRTGTHSELF